jgi:hypothetical protein
MRPTRLLPRSRPRRLAIELAVLVAIFSFGGFAGPTLAAQLTQVFVTNTSANPVPVTLQGTPAIALASGATVNVANEATFTPVSILEVVGTADGSSIGGEVCYTVPNGSRLVVEQEVAAFTFGTPDQDVTVSVGAEGGNPQAWLHMDYPGSTQLVRMYVDPGVRVFCNFSRRITTGATGIVVGFTGHLVTLP